MFIYRHKILNMEADAPIFDELGSDKDKGYLFVFTDFNMDKKFSLTDEIRGIGWGREVCPTTGKEHLQGMIQVFKQSRFKAIIKLLGGNVWIKVARGTVEQCKEYCSKEGLYTQYGNFVRKGQKLQGIVENYEAGNSIIDIIENNEDMYMK
ncbi:replication protein, partial [uncultured marine virus]